MTDKQFSPEELEALYQILKEYQENAPENNDEYYDEYEQPISRKLLSSILKKVSPQLPKETKIEIDKEFLRRKYHPYNNKISDKVYSTLKRALEQLEMAEFKKRKINICYTSTKYTIGYCHLRKDMRKFRTSRIASAKLTDQTYNIPKDFHKNDY